MAYATVDQLAAAMRVAVTPKNSAALESCLESAAETIDHICGRFPDDPIPAGDALAEQKNVAMAVEIYKASDAIFGGVGFADVGILKVPVDLAARHAADLIPLTQTFGIA